MSRSNNTRPDGEMYHKGPSSAPYSSSLCENTFYPLLSSSPPLDMCNARECGFENDPTRFSNPGSSSSFTYPPFNPSSHTSLSPPPPPLLRTSNPSPQIDAMHFLTEYSTFQIDEGRGPNDYDDAGVNTLEMDLSSVNGTAAFSEDVGGVGEVAALPPPFPPGPFGSFERRNEKMNNERGTTIQEHHYSHRRHQRKHGGRHSPERHQRRTPLSASFEDPPDLSYPRLGSSQSSSAVLPPPPIPLPHHQDQEMMPFAPSSSDHSSALRSTFSVFPSFPLVSHGGEIPSRNIPSCAPELVIPAPWGAGSCITFSESLLMDLLAAAVARGGPLVEKEVAKREEANPDFAFLQVEWNDPRSRYYRWRLYSLLQGDTLTCWRTEPFQLVAEAEAYAWKPPPAILSPSDYLLFASRGDTLSASSRSFSLPTSVAWTTIDTLEGSSSMTKADSSICLDDNSSDQSAVDSCRTRTTKKERSSSPQLSTADSVRDTLFPLPSIWKFSREVPKKYSRLIEVLEESDESTWRQEIHLTCKKNTMEGKKDHMCWMPAYTPLLSSRISTSFSSLDTPSPPGSTVTEDSLMAHWKAWLDDWHQNTFSASFIGGKMAKAIEVSNGGTMAEHVLSTLLDEVLRVAFENSTLLRRVTRKKTKESIFFTIKAVEEICAEFASHCLQLQWYLFLLHDILSNAMEKPFKDEVAVAEYAKKERRKKDEMEVEYKKNTPITGGNRKQVFSSPNGARAAEGAGCETHSGDLSFRGTDEVDTLLQFPPPPISERKEQHSAAAAALEERTRRRQSWSRALELILVAWIEANSLVIFNTLFVTGDVSAYPLKTELGAEEELGGEPSSSSIATNHAKDMAAFSSGGGSRSGMPASPMHAESDDSRKVRAQLSPTAGWFLQPPLPPLQQSSSGVPPNPSSVLKESAVGPSSTLLFSPSSAPLCDRPISLFSHPQSYLNPGSDPHIRRLCSILHQNVLEMAMMLLSWLRFLLLQWHEGVCEGSIFREEGMDGVEEKEEDRKTEFRVHGSLKRRRSQNPKEKPLVGLRLYAKMLERYPFLRFESRH